MINMFNVFQVWSSSLSPNANLQDDTLVADDDSFRKVVLQLFSLEDGDHVDEDFVDGAGDDFDPNHDCWWWGQRKGVG